MSISFLRPAQLPAISRRGRFAIEERCRVASHAARILADRCMRAGVRRRGSPLAILQGKQDRPSRPDVFKPKGRRLRAGLHRHYLGGLPFGIQVINKARARDQTIFPECSGCGLAAGEKQRGNSGQFDAERRAPPARCSTRLSVLSWISP